MYAWSSLKRVLNAVFAMHGHTLTKRIKQRLEGDIVMTTVRVHYVPLLYFVTMDASRNRW